MIVPVAALLLALVPLLLGGRLSRLGALRLRSTEVVAVALGVQTLVISVLPWPRAVLEAVHVASYLVAAVFVWANRRVPGLPLLGAGALCNGLTIALNGGTLPASPSALARAGMPLASNGFTNSGALPDARLAALGDVFAVPAGWPLSNVFSIGDVLVVLGAGWASWRICGTWWTEAWSPREAGHARGRHIAGLLGGALDGPPRPRVPARRARAGWTTFGPGDAALRRRMLEV